MIGLNLFVGYFGRKNLGDDLMLNVLYKNEKDYVLLQDSNFYSFISDDKQIVLNLNPIYKTLQKIYNLFKLKRQNVNKIIFGGGTQFSSSSSIITQIDIFIFLVFAKLLGYKIEANSIGIGAFSSKNFLIKSSLKLFDHISVRDKTSSFKLKKALIRHDLGNDLVYKINFNKKKVKIPDKILITATGSVLALNKTYLNNYLEFIVKNVPKNYENLVYTVFQEDEDEFIYKILKKTFSNIKIQTPKTNFEIEKLYNSSIEVIGMRYHSLILADIFNLPFKGFSYDDKVKDLCRKKNMVFKSAK